MKKSILKQMAAAGAKAGERTEVETVNNPLSARRQSPVISNVGRALTHLSEDIIVTLDASKIDRSPFRDRFDSDAEADADLENLKISIASEGQKIPILVRVHPTKAGQYQLAYGYRRLAAIKALNSENESSEALKVKAYIRELSDRQLIEEQSLENGIREDLTWIEQAMWAVQLKKVGLTQRAICPILGLSEAAISHFGKVTSIIPDDIIYKIGRAKSVGRPKWTSLAELMQDIEKIDLVRSLITTPDFIASDSQARFSQIFDAIKDKANADNRAPAAKSWTSKDESVSFTMNKKSRKVAIELSSEKSAPFGDWIADNLDVLYEMFQTNKNNTGE